MSRLLGSAAMRSRRLRTSMSPSPASTALAICRCMFSATAVRGGATDCPCKVTTRRAHDVMATTTPSASTNLGVMRILVLVKLQLVTRLRLRLVDHAFGQLENRVRPQTKRDAAFHHVLPCFEDHTLLAEEDHIDGELHRKGMDSFARSNPKSLSFRQAGVLKQTSAPLL